MHCPPHPPPRAPPAPPPPRRPRSPPRGRALGGFGPAPARWPGPLAGGGLEGAAESARRSPCDQTHSRKAGRKAAFSDYARRLPGTAPTLTLPASGGGERPPPYPPPHAGEGIRGDV